MSRLVLLILVVFTLGLGACAPAIQGGSAHAAYNLSEGEKVAVNAGGSWYFYDTWSAKYLGVELPKIPDAAFDPNTSQGRTFTHNVNSNQFTVSASDLPDGWSLRLQTARGVQTIADRDRSGRYIEIRWYETVKLVFAVDVPAGATAGTYRTTVLVKSSNGSEVSFPVKIMVENSSTQL